MDNPKIDLHLCAGYDGIGRGLELAGVSKPHGTIYVEIEAYACKNMVDKIEAGELGPAVCHSDLKNFPYQDLAGHVRLLTAGFPCQPFSSAGKREGVDDPRHLWPHIARGISQCRPEVVFCENVEGIISSKTSEGQSVLQYVLESLEGMGYRATAGIFSAEEVGAPHRRKRVFILAHSQSERTNGESRDVCKEERRQGSALSREPQRSGCELANPQSESRRGLSIGEAQELTEFGSTGQHELAYRTDIGRRGWSDQDGADRGGLSELQGQERPVVRSEAEGCGGDSREELANPHSPRLQGHRQPREQSLQEGWQGANGHAWPSRPGEPQYDWEAPRTIDGKLNATWVEQLQGLPVWWTGTGSRTDRLRLLGNGVVPQTASIAWKTLWRKL